MEVASEEDILLTLLFADQQVACVHHKGDAHYMVINLQEEQDKCGLQIILMKQNIQL